jgi:mono/diheme cytochrome c family protein
MHPQFTGVANDGRFLDTVPVALTRGVVERGRERFEIYCSPCHGRAGDGYGMIALRGLHGAPSLLTDRIRREPPGYIFAVISNGFGAMPDYAEQIVPNDRWAIITYVRALQLSRPEAAK